MGTTTITLAVMEQGEEPTVLPQKGWLKCRAAPTAANVQSHWVFIVTPTLWEWVYCTSPLLFWQEKVLTCRVHAAGQLPAWGSFPNSWFLTPSNNLFITGIDNNVIVTRGKWGRGEVEKGKGSQIYDVKISDFGWWTQCRMQMGYIELYTWNLYN